MHFRGVSSVKNFNNYIVSIALVILITGLLFQSCTKDHLNINQDPYGEGWLAIIDAGDWPADQAQLLDPQGYFNHMVLEAEQEAKNL